MSQTRDGVAKGDGGQTAAIREAAVSQSRDGVGNGDGGQTAAIPKAVIPQTRDGVGNGDESQIAAIIVFINRFISIAYTLNDRKVIT